MRFKLGVMSLLLVCSAIAINAQERSTQKKELVVEVPREIVLPTVAYQPNCPLQFENVKLLAGVDGGVLDSYDLRNRGTKPIRTITIGGSYGARWSWDVASQFGPVMPGQLVPDLGDDDWIQVVPLTKELREKLKLQGPMMARTVLMVIRVEFTDGTSYDDEPTYKALQNYLENLSGKLDRLEYLERQRK